MLKAEYTRFFVMNLYPIETWKPQWRVFPLYQRKFKNSIYQQRDFGREGYNRVVGRCLCVICNHGDRYRLRSIQVTGAAILTRLLSGDPAATRHTHRMLAGFVLFLHFISPSFFTAVRNSIPTPIFIKENI